MSTLREIENYLRKITADDKNPAYATEICACHLALDYWAVFDSLHHSDRNYLFRQLYMKKVHKNTSQVKLSIDLAISGSTLYRYRKLFVESFVFYCNQLNPAPNGQAFKI